MSELTATAFMFCGFFVWISFPRDWVNGPWDALLWIIGMFFSIFMGGLFGAFAALVLEWMNRWFK